MKVPDHNFRVTLDIYPIPLTPFPQRSLLGEGGSRMNEDFLASKARQKILITSREAKCIRYWCYTART